MTLYARRQLLVLLVLLAAAGGGLAVGHWRRAHPDVVEQVELLDRAPAPVDERRRPSTREPASGRAAHSRGRAEARAPR